MKVAVLVYVVPAGLVLGLVLAERHWLYVGAILFMQTSGSIERGASARLELAGRHIISVAQTMAIIPVRIIPRRVAAAGLALVVRQFTVANL
jgi:hypothetical protein